MKPPKQKIICEICGKTFLTQTKYTQHKYDVHPAGSKLFKCDLCNMTFNYKFALDKHKKRVHIIKHFVCKTCHKQYKTRFNLKKHCLKHNHTFA